MLYPLSYGGGSAAKSHGLESIMPKTSVRDLPYEVWALLLGMFTVSLGYGVVAPVLPAYAREFGVGFAAASAIVSAFAVMRLIFAPASGSLVKRFGERKVYVVGILIVAVTTGACAFAGEYWQLVTLRALAGIGSTMFSVSAMGLLIKLSPVDARARVASLNSGSFMVGGVAGPLLGAAFASLGFRAPFVFYFVLLLIAASIVGITLRNSQVVSSDEHNPEHPAMTLRQALQRSQYRAALSSAFAHGWATIGVRSALIPLFVVAVLGESPAVAGLMFATFAVANLIFLMPAGRWADQYGRKPFILVGLIISTAGLLLLTATDHLWWAVAVVAIGGVGSAFTAPAQQAVVADVLGKRARGGQVLATYQMSTDFGAVLGPIVAGIVIDLAGFDWGLTAGAVVLALAAAIWLFTPDSKQLQPKTEPIPTQPESA